MLEEIAGTGRPTPLTEEFGVHELGQLMLQRGLLYGRERVQEFVGKLPAQHSHTQGHQLRPPTNPRFL